VPAPGIDVARKRGMLTWTVKETEQLYKTYFTRSDWRTCILPASHRHRPRPGHCPHHERRRKRVAKRARTSVASHVQAARCATWVRLRCSR